MNPRTLNHLIYPFNCKPFSKVSVDSRTIDENTLFFALKGAFHDGHNFLKDVAKQNGASAVVSKDYKGEDFGLSLLRVENVLDFLQEMARQFGKTLKAKVIGVTGSVGKTTTKNFITTLLSERFFVKSSPGNQNSQIGVPLTILNHYGYGEEFIVQEMGMSKPKEIEKLVSILPPDVALITAVCLAHGANFSSFEEIVCEKADILQHPKTTLKIVSKEIQFAKTLSSEVKVFSLDDLEADYTIYLENYFEKGNLVGPFLHFPLNGEHHKKNCLAAIAASYHFLRDWDLILKGVSKLKLPEKRGEVVEKKGVFFVNDSYNACLSSFIAAFETLPKPKNQGKRIAVIGEMEELGHFSFMSHLEVAKKGIGIIDQFFCLGKGCEPMVDFLQTYKVQATLFSSREKIVENLQKTINSGDVVLLKGANSHELWKILDEI